MYLPYPLLVFCVLIHRDAGTRSRSILLRKGEKEKGGSGLDKKSPILPVDLKVPQPGLIYTFQEPPKPMLIFSSTMTGT
jgi:hypothetical protein